MQLRILQASTFALDNLKKASVPTVHSVYHKAVNLRTGDQMLTLQPRASVLSPVSLITDYTEEMLADLTFMVRPTTELFHLNTSHTCCQDLFLPLSGSETVQSSLHLSGLDTKIREAIAMAGSSPLPAHMRGMELILNQPELLENSLYMRAASQYLTQFIQILQASEDFYEMADCLCHLIGLGIGLTPSGDDFLCGFLAGLRLSDGSSVFLPFLEQHILHTLDRTNEISATFLRCAVLGQFSAPVHLLTNPDVTARQIYLAFSSIGSFFRYRYTVRNLYRIHCLHFCRQTSKKILTFYFSLHIITIVNYL